MNQTYRQEIGLNSTTGKPDRATSAGVACPLQRSGALLPFHASIKKIIDRLHPAPFAGTVRAGKKLSLPSPMFIRLSLNRPALSDATSDNAYYTTI